MKKFKELLDIIKGKNTKYGKADYGLVICTLMLIIFGLVMIFSASYYWSISKFGSPYVFLRKQIIWIILGFFCFIAGSSVDYHIFAKNKIRWMVMILGIALLVIVQIPGVGSTLNNATRWIQLGPLTIMPGEVAKLCCIIFAASYLSRKPDSIEKKSNLAMVLICTAIVAFLIIIQPNLSTAITVVVIIGIMLIVAGISAKNLLMAIAIGLVGGLGVIKYAHKEYWITRITTAADPFDDPLGDGYQIVQSLYAIGSGGLRGLGLGKSVQKNLYLPEPQTDYILAIIGEELGFLGIMLLLAIYCGFLWRGARIALYSKDLMGMLLASGIVIMVGLQVVLNVGIVTAVLPSTGINLPFVSYGGNALLLFMYATGILINISRQQIGKSPGVDERINNKVKQ